MWAALKTQIPRRFVPLRFERTGFIERSVARIQSIGGRA